MKKINVIVKDKNTLVLNEDASKGDVIDLTALNTVDTTSILESISNGSNSVYNQKVEEAKRTFELENQAKVEQVKNDYEKRIAELEKINSNKEYEFKLKLNDSLTEKDKEILTLEGNLKNSKTEFELKQQAIKDEYEAKLRMKEEEVAYYKDLKAKSSTKMVGESLEQHCQNEFNKVRMMAFPNAYFEKDNEVSLTTGSKGDFIYRENNEDGSELLSIMFEMKNEMDTTASKHKNEDFFKELDKDRKEKKCEFAVLVTMLEADNDYYNAGIVDVSYRYPKMYVVRPQCFLTIIGLLRNNALSTVQYKNEIQEMKNQNLDITKFETNLANFKDKFGKNYQLASTRFAKAIEDIDKTIAHLQKVKDDLIGSENQLRLANDKAQELTIKKLTKDCPALREQFSNEGEEN